MDKETWNNYLYNRTVMHAVLAIGCITCVMATPWVHGSQLGPTNVFQYHNANNITLRLAFLLNALTGAFTVVAGFTYTH